MADIFTLKNNFDHSKGEWPWVLRHSSNPNPSESPEFKPCGRRFFFQIKFWNRRCHTIREWSHPASGTYTINDTLTCHGWLKKICTKTSMWLCGQIGEGKKPNFDHIRSVLSQYLVLPNNYFKSVISLRIISNEFHTCTYFT